MPKFRIDLEEAGGKGEKGDSFWVIVFNVGDEVDGVEQWRYFCFKSLQILIVDVLLRDLMLYLERIKIT